MFSVMSISQSFCHSVILSVHRGGGHYPSPLPSPYRAPWTCSNLFTLTSSCRDPQTYWKAGSWSSTEIPSCVSIQFIICNIRRCCYCAGNKYMHSTIFYSYDILRSTDKTFKHSFIMSS